MRWRSVRLCALVLFCGSTVAFVPSPSSVSGSDVMLLIPRRSIHDIEFELAAWDREQDAKFLAALPKSEGTVTAAAKVDTGPSEGTIGAQEPQQIAYEEGSIEALICSVFVEDCAGAVRRARCESRFNPEAVNGQYRGLFQIGVVTHAARIERLGYTADDMFSAWPNIEVAHDLFMEQGWGPWQCG